MVLIYTKNILNISKKVKINLNQEEFQEQENHCINHFNFQNTIFTISLKPCYVIKKNIIQKS